MQLSRSVNAKAAKSVLMRTSGMEKLRCTVMLVVTADERKLPPYIICGRRYPIKAFLGDFMYVFRRDAGHPR